MAKIGNGPGGLLGIAESFKTATEIGGGESDLLEYWRTR